MDIYLIIRIIIFSLILPWFKLNPIPNPSPIAGKKSSMTAFDQLWITTLGLYKASVAAPPSTNTHTQNKNKHKEEEKNV